MTLQEMIEQRFSGVYLLMDGGVVVYVGESCNVPARIQQHVQEGVKQFDSFRIFYCSDRKRKEAELIRILAPKYNITGKPCSGGVDNVWQGERINDALSTIVELSATASAPYRCGWNLLRDFLDYPRFHRLDVIAIMKKYGALLDADEEGGDSFDLIQVLKFKKQIQEELWLI